MLENLLPGELSIEENNLIVIATAESDESHMARTANLCRDLDHCLNTQRKAGTVYFQADIVPRDKTIYEPILFCEDIQLKVCGK